MIRTVFTWALGLGLVALVGTSANAQGRGGFGGGMGSPAMLLGNKSVQKELNLTDEQIEKAGAIATEMREKMQEKMQDIPQEERREKMPAIMAELNKEVMKSVKEVLKPEQATRLDQIAIQAAGLQAFARPDVAAKLKVTDEQKEKIKAIQEESGAAMREIFQGAGDDREGAMKKIAELRKETFEKAVALMSDDQKKAWKEMTGKPFTVVQERRPN